MKFNERKLGAESVAQGCVELLQKHAACFVYFQDPLCVKMKQCLQYFHSFFLSFFHSFMNTHILRYTYCEKLVGKKKKKERKEEKNGKPIKAPQLLFLLFLSLNVFAPLFCVPF